MIRQPCQGRDWLTNAHCYPHYSLFIIHLTMIYAPVTTPAQLLAALPHLLDTLEEADEFWKYLNEGHDPACDLYLDDFSEEHAKAYTSLREAFEDHYPGDIDEWKADRCCDYQCCFSDFTDLYEDWLFANHLCRWIGDKLIISH